MNATPFTPNFVGSLGRYPFFDYVDSKSNNTFLYNSNLYYLYTIDSNSTSSNISNLYNNDNTTGSNISNIYYSTGLLDSNVLWYQGELFKTQLDVIAQKGQIVGLQTSDTIQSASISTMSLSLINHTSRLDSIDGQISSINNNTFTKDQTSNIFVSSNVLSNTSNNCYSASSNNCFKNSSNFTYSTSNDVYSFSSNNCFQNSSNNTLLTSNDCYSNSSNNSFQNSSNFTYLTSNGCYFNSSNNSFQNSSNFTKSIKSLLDASITTQKLTIDTTDINSNDSILNVSNMICVRKIQNTVEPFDSFDICMGTGNINTLTLTEVSNDGFVLYTNNYCGLKILNNKRIIITTPEKFYLNSIKTLFLSANRIKLSSSTSISLSGDIDTNGTIIKKAPKYFTTSRTANFDGVSCLAYDIDLTKISSKQTVDGIDFRHFRIKFFFASGRVDYQWSPRSFDVSLSTYNTLSVCCNNGWGVSLGLDVASTDEYFLYKQNIDLITFCAPTSAFGTTNLKICYIIEDLVSQ